MKFLMSSQFDFVITEFSFYLQLLKVNKILQGDAPTSLANSGGVVITRSCVSLLADFSIALWNRFVYQLHNRMFAIPR